MNSRRGIVPDHFIGSRTVFCATAKHESIGTCWMAMYSQKNLAYFTDLGKNDDKAEIKIKAYHHPFTNEFKPFPSAVIQSGGS